MFRPMSNIFKFIAVLLHGLDNSVVTKLSRLLILFKNSYKDHFSFPVINDSISVLCLSECERYLVCAGACGTTAIWRKNKNRWSHFKNLPKRDCAPTAITINNKSSRIVLAFPDYKVRNF